MCACFCPFYVYPACVILCVGGTSLKKVLSGSHALYIKRASGKVTLRRFKPQSNYCENKK